MLQLNCVKVTSSSSEARSMPKLLHTKSFCSVNSQNNIENVMNSYCSIISECFSTVSDPHLLDTCIPVNESNFFQGRLFIGMPCQPTYSPHTSSSHLGTVQQCCLPGDPCLSLNTSFCFLPFNYTNTLFTLYKLISPLFLCFYFS